MSFNKGLSARTSGFQNNCALNALVHTLNKKTIKDRINEAVSAVAPTPLQTNIRASTTKLVNEFNQYYGLTGADAVKDWNELGQKLEGLDSSLHREVVLGPVLRQMLAPSLKANTTDELEDTEVLGLANGFGLNVESYCSWQADGGTNVIPAPANPHPQMPNSIGTLKLFNTVGHWEFEGEDGAEVAIHNQYYDGSNLARPLYRTKYVARLRAAIRAGLLARRPLRDVFTQYESVVGPRNATSGLSANAGGMNIMSAIEQGFSQLGNLFGGNSSTAGMGSWVSGIGGFLKEIFKFFFGFMQVTKQIGKQMNPDMELDEEDYQNHPLSSDYNDMLRKVAAVDEQAASKLNRAWRTDTSPTKERAMSTLVDTLVRTGLGNEAHEFLRAQEDKVLNDSGRNVITKHRLNIGEGIETLFKKIDELQFTDATHARELKAIFNLRRQLVGVIEAASEELDERKEVLDRTIKAGQKIAADIRGLGASPDPTRAANLRAAAVEATAEIRKLRAEYVTAQRRHDESYWTAHQQLASKVMGVWQAQEQARIQRENDLRNLPSPPNRPPSASAPSSGGASAAGGGMGAGRREASSRADGLGFSPAFNAANAASAPARAPASAGASAAPAGEARASAPTGVARVNNGPITPAFAAAQQQQAAQAALAAEAARANSNSNRLADLSY